MKNNETILAAAIEKSISDSSFKSQLMNNYESAIASLGHGELEFSNNKSILFVDKSSSHYSDDLISESSQNVIISIPENITVDNLELSDKDMEAISGGINPLYMLYVRYKAKKAGQAAAAAALEDSEDES